MRIERDIINQFIAWKGASVRKPILLKGARQIGKTWAMGLLISTSTASAIPTRRLKRNKPRTCVG